MPKWLPRWTTVAVLLAAAATARAQQPFYTDDAHVADLHHWHIESNNEYDFLPAGSFPNLRQDTQTIKFSVGAFRQCEVGMDFPLITIFNQPGFALGTPIGLGDMDFSIKYRFREEKEGSHLPAFTVSLNLEPPTGSSKKQLGSGLMDYYLNGIMEKTLTKKLTLRLNGGATFAGNTLTGVIGIKTRGTIFTGGASLVRQFTPKLDLGVEVTGGFTSNLQLGRGQLAEQLGGNYELKKNLTLDFGFVAGQAVGSPRWGYQLGFSKDF
jgi:outer membrane putative beta-barrel porin/alpha-amylase